MFIILVNTMKNIIKFEKLEAQKLLKNYFDKNIYVNICRTIDQLF